MLKITHALLESAKRHSRESEHDPICYFHKKNNESLSYLPTNLIALLLAF